MMETKTILSIGGVGAAAFFSAMFLFFMYGEGETPILNINIWYRVIIWAVVVGVTALAIFVMPYFTKVKEDEKEKFVTWEDKALDKRELEERAWNAIEEGNEEYMGATGWRLEFEVLKGRDAIVAVFKKGGLSPIKKIIPIGRSKFDSFSSSESHERHKRVHDENLQIVDSYAPITKSEMRAVKEEPKKAEVKEE